MGLQYEPSSEPLHISAKHVFSGVFLRQQLLERRVVDLPPDSSFTKWLQPLLALINFTYSSNRTAVYSRAKITINVWPTLWALVP